MAASLKFFKITGKFAFSARGIAAAKGDTVNILMKTKTGRMLLHALCVLRCPRHASWHWQGILREFAR